MTETEEHDVVQWMRTSMEAFATLRKMNNMPGLPAEWAYDSYEAYLLGEGQAWAAQGLPDGFVQGEVKNCYENTLLLVMADQAEGGDLRYVEGKAIGKACIAVDHAWAVDGEGRVIDVTWPEPENAHYWGVAFELHDVVSVVIEQDLYGLLCNDWLRDNQLLRHGSLVGEHDE